jgi:hypothetical protein
VTDTVDQAPETAANGTEPPPEDGWQRDGRGRRYVQRPAGAKGVVFRRGDETIAEALARDASTEPPKGKDRRPRPRSKRPPLPPPPQHVDLKELEKLLTEALKAPAMPCAMFGDEWAADHFVTHAPNVARNLVLAAEHNPWLARKLTELASGQDAAVKLLGMAGVAGALFAYAVPPIIYFLNLPVPPKGREMLGIPARQDPDHAPSPAGAPAAAVA